MNNIDSIIETLNEHQQKAVFATEGFVRVIAGAGSGKTKALTARFAFLVETLGINPANILCVTFTNKAANEIRNRVRQIVGENNDYGYITTYHGFCVKVLREDILKIKYPRQFIIMDIEDQKTILSEIYEELNINSKDYTYKQTIKHIDILKSSTNYIDFIVQNDEILLNNGNCLKDSPNISDRIFIKYIEKQLKNFALDFNDLILFTIYIFDKNKDVLEKWQKRLFYIMVDEVQDSSTKQFYLVDLLSNIHKNLFVVGDPDQTIYEWRGARPDILVNFHEKYIDSQTIIMNQNYRSTKNILNLCNTVIKKNKIRIDKDMVTLNSNGGDVIHYHAKNDSEEGDYIASEIKKLASNSNLKYSDIAILYRANHVSRIIEQSLIKESIPYTIWGGIRFFERKEIKDILAYLRLIVFGDDLSLLRIVNVPSRKLGKAFIEEIKRKAEHNRTSLFQTISTEATNKKSAIDFINLINELKEKKDSKSISDLVKEILDKTGLSEMYRIDGDEDRLQNIIELQNSIMSIERNDNDKLSLENYLQEIALYTDLDIDSKNTNRVKLMTIHTSKGLEFPCVFLCGFTDGILPSDKALKEKRLEEERRLTYVAVTRAEKTLYITESEGFSIHTGKNKYPSRFLFDIEDNLYVRRGTLSQEFIDIAKKQINMETEMENELKKEIPILNIGDFVSFSSWGNGIVIEKDETNKVYMIKFDKINAVRPIRFDWRGLIKLDKNESSPEIFNSIKN